MGPLYIPALNQERCLSRSAAPSTTTTIDLNAVLTIDLNAVLVMPNYHQIPVN